MWVSAVFGVIASRCATWRVDAPRAIERQHLDLARGEPGRAAAPLAAWLAGGGEHGVDRVGVEPAGADLGAQLAARLLGGQRRAVGRGARSWPGTRRRRRAAAPVAGIAGR